MPKGDARTESFLTGYIFGGWGVRWVGRTGQSRAGDKTHKREGEQAEYKK